MLGVAGLLSAYRAGRVALANAHRHRRRRRQVDLPLRAGHDPLLPRRGADARQRADLAVPQAEGPRLRARAPARAGGQGGAGLGRLRHAGRPGGEHSARSSSSAARLKATPADYIAQPTLALSTCPTFVGRRRRAAPRRPAPVRAVAASEVNIVPGGLTRVALQGGLAGGQLVAGRRHQGHLGGGLRCCRASPTGSSGCRATSSAPRTWRACSA